MINKYSVSKLFCERGLEVIFILVLITSFANSAFGDETNGTISGQVFIVTKAAENVRLGLVAVMLFPENDITNYVAERNKRIDDDRPDFDKQIADLDETISKMKADLAKSEASTEQLKALGDEVSIERSLNENSKTALAIFEQLRESTVKAKENWPASSHYFNNLPIPLTSTRTDADGKFSLEIPKQGRFAIAAHASRKIPSANEEYYWMVWLSMNGKESANIILGNQNLMSSGSQDSVVSTKSD